MLELELPDGPLLTVRMTSIAEFVAGDVVAVEIDPQPGLCLSGTCRRCALTAGRRALRGRGVFCDTSGQAHDPAGPMRAARGHCERESLMSIGIWQVVLILVIVLILFGAGKLPKVMGDVAKGVKNFKTGMKDDDEDDKRGDRVRRCRRAGGGSPSRR